ncbi:UNVERIFIED_CONTAM: Transposon Tf2-12 polyprotein [Sesamum radiatum]|uniref:Transposon Tf2-12 polyprotein n=1 Tax=Sesamum radiatum TaxID=300843 RepID=A0AAW2L2W0_SESRA
MLRDQIGHNIEVYINDMLVKSIKEQDHIDDLQMCFQILKSFGLKLNPTKCTFEVRGGKFLGYMISKRGIEANPEKISAIKDMSPPHSIKDVQKLTGRLAALNRFISRSADKGLPFFKVLQGATNFEWTIASQEACDDLRRYLTLPPLLTKPKTVELLYLYLAISESSVSSVLVQHEGKGHHVVYYVSKVLQGAGIDTLRSKISSFPCNRGEETGPYFQLHQIIVLTNHPLKQVLVNPEPSGRMVKWAVELSVFDIEFHPRPTIKAQVLADLIVKITHDDASISAPTWSLYVDGSSMAISNEAGIVLESPQGDKLEYVIKLEFLASNNDAEYEGSYEARGEKMAKYLLEAKELFDKFEETSPIQVSRTDNATANQLAKIASSMAIIYNRRITFLSSNKAAVDQQVQTLCTNTPLRAGKKIS